MKFQSSWFRCHSFSIQSWWLYLRQLSLSHQVVGPVESFVNCYLPCFGLQLMATYCYSATVASFLYLKFPGELPATFSSRLCLLKVCLGDALSLFSASNCVVSVYLKLRVGLSHPPSPMPPRHPTPFAKCPFQFLVYYSVFWFYFCFCFPRAGVRLSRELSWFYPRGAVGIPPASYFCTCWSTSPRQVRSWHLVVQVPSWFFSVTWHGEALHSLGVRGVGVLFLLGGFSCLMWL
jgi:hypothetical protein